MSADSPDEPDVADGLPAPGGDWELKAIVSSTWRDLGKHRAAVQQACLTAQVVPIMMEHLLPQDIGIVEKSLEMVDQADLYIGLFGLRYGTVPKGEKRSVTEIEYERARERQLERLIFTLSDKHRPKIAPLETTKKAQDALRRLKARLGALLVGEFTSVEDLKFRVFGALEKFQRRRKDRELLRARQVVERERQTRLRREAEVYALAKRLEALESAAAAGPRRAPTKT